MNEPIIVFAVNKIYCLAAMLISGQIEEVTNSVCFFANIVTVSRKGLVNWKLYLKYSQHDATISDLLFLHQFL